MLNKIMLKKIVGRKAVNKKTVMKKKMFQRIDFFAFVTVLAVALLASLPVLTDYVIVTKELNFHMLRIEAMVQHIGSGGMTQEMQTKWMISQGYQDVIFHCDTFLVIPALLRLFGMGISTVYNLFILLINMATAILSYFVCKKCFDNSYYGVFGCALYTLFPYRIMTIYEYGAVGEVLAMIFLPLLGLGFYKILTEDREKKEYQRLWLLPVIAFTGMLQSHVLFSCIVGLGAILFCVLCYKKVFKKQTLWVLSKTVIVTVLVNIWSFVPFLGIMCSDELYKNHVINELIQGAARLSEPFGSRIALFYCVAAIAVYWLFREKVKQWRKYFCLGLGAALILFSIYQLNDIVFTKTEILRVDAIQVMDINRNE